MAKVFISYSRKDIDFAKRLTGELQKSDLDFWIDWEGIPPTVDWWKEIQKGIEEADIFLFLISPDSAKSKICGQEIDTAVKNGKRIIPIVLREIQWEDTPPQLGHLNYIFFSRDDNFDTAVKKLMNAIQTDYEWAATHRRLQVKALDWERNKKNDGFLLRSKDLLDAETNLARNTSKEPHPTDLQREYVLQSRKATDRQRRITTGLSISTVIALAILAVFGFVQAGRATANAKEAQNNAATAIANEHEAKRQTQIALARQLAAQAQNMKNGIAQDQGFAKLLAVLSMKLFPTGDAANVLVSGQSPSVIEMFHEDEVVSVVFSPDGRYVASGSYDNTARVWSLASGLEIARMTHDDWVLSVAFSPNGKYVASGSRDRTARVWEPSSGTEVARITHGISVISVAFSPDGKYVVSAGCEELDIDINCVKGSVRVWEAMSGKEIARMNHDSYVNSATFSPDGKYVVSAGNVVSVWEASSGKEIARMNQNGVASSAIFSPDGKYVVSADIIVHVWEVFSGKEIARIPHNNSVDAFALSPDGKYVVTGDADGERIWELTSSREITFVSNNFGVNTVSFSPNGKYIVSGSWLDSNASVIEASTGKELTRMSHGGSVRTAVFSPDGEYVVSASADKTVRVWMWQPEDLIRDNCFGNLTHAEWNLYIGDTLPYQAICPDIPLEPEGLPTPTVAP